MVRNEGLPRKPQKGGKRGICIMIGCFIFASFAIKEDLYSKSNSAFHGRWKR